MTLTTKDVGRNPFGLFSLERNSAQDTPIGVRVLVRKQDRTHLAGYRQEDLRHKLGLVVDSAADNAVFITGQTIASLQALLAQYESDRVDTARTERQRKREQAKCQLISLLAEVNQLEQQFVDVTSMEELERRFEDMFEGESSTTYALRWLENRKTWFVAATTPSGDDPSIAGMYIIEDADLDDYCVQRRKDVLRKNKMAVEKCLERGGMSPDVVESMRYEEEEDESNKIILVFSKVDGSRYEFCASRRECCGEIYEILEDYRFGDDEPQFSAELKRLR